MNKPNRSIQAAAGHLIDLVNLVSFRFDNPHSYSKFRIIDRVRKLSCAETLIETGTYRGVTTSRCARVFEHVFSIELDPELAASAAEFLRKRTNVKVIQGDGLIEVPKLLERENVNDVLVFLDGHYSGSGTALGDMAEPACEELIMLAGYRDQICAIVIDDFRCFGVEKDWPKKSEVVRVLEDIFPDFTIVIHMDQVIAFRKSRQ